MYKLLLIRKYLLKRRIAWVSLIAVMLCTAMVLVVISVMGGWLRMFRESFHGLTGDVIVHGQSLTGFPYYEEMVARIEGLPDVKAAVPTIESFGLININNVLRKGVQVVGYPFDQIGKVNGFPASIYTYRQHLLDRIERLQHEADTGFESIPETERDDMLLRAANLQHALDTGPTRSDAEKRLLQTRIDQIKREAQSGRHQLSDLEREDRRGRVIADRKDEAELPHVDSWDKLLPPAYYKGMFPSARNDVSQWPNMIIGVGLWGGRKDPDSGKVKRPDVLFESWAKLTTLAISPDSSSIDVPGDKQERNYWIVGDSKTNLWQVDLANIYVPLEQLQSDLKMKSSEFTDDKGEKHTSPARVTDLQISFKPGVDQKAGRELVRRIVEEVQASHGTDLAYPVSVQTWDESQAQFLGAVEKEKGLVTVLFGMISIVAVFLIFCIFFMIVVEKTKDIGIIKSVGATGGGVAAIFLGYGLAIGIVGGMMGLGLGYLIVHNINELHTAMGRFLHVQIWTAETYAFDTIPNTMNPNEVAVIVSVAILASVLGAVVPALRAARMNPVDALRFE